MGFSASITEVNETDYILVEQILQGTLPAQMSPSDSFLQYKKKKHSLRQHRTLMSITHLLTFITIHKGQAAFSIIECWQYNDLQLLITQTHI